MSNDDISINYENDKRLSSWYIMGLIIMIIPVGLILLQWIRLGLIWMVIAILMLLTICVTGLSLGKGWVGCRR
jgi:hypothetical protein